MRNLFGLPGKSAMFCFVIRISATSKIYNFVGSDGEYAVFKRRNPNGLRVKKTIKCGLKVYYLKVQIRRFFHRVYLPI